MLLTVEDLSVSYAAVPALRGISLSVRRGQIVGLIGANGAGKTTAVKAIVGLVKARGGSVVFDGTTITGKSPEEIVGRGIACVPEGRQVFATLTVAENLALGSTPLPRQQRHGAMLERVLDRFPALSKYYRTPAGKLSGGEQQQLAIGRALLSAPKLLILDEPSLGLAPKVVDVVFETLAELRDDGVTILLVEQNASRTVGLADHTYVLKVGTVALSGSRAELATSAGVAEAYLGA